MRLKFTCYIVSILLSHFSFGQIDELKKAQDKGRQKIHQPSNATYFSKALYVNPFIGTGGHGHTYPGATAPFGMMQLSPDTRHDGWDGCSGYHYSDSIIYGFSHTHLSGTGVSDYADLLIVPQNGKPKIDPGYTDKKGYKSSFSHDQEKATPGYYGVKLIDSDIDVHLTVTERAGFHKYMFNNPKGKKFILIDLDHRDKLLSSELNILDKTTISGARISNSWAEEQHFYFYLKLDTPYQKARLFKKNGKNKLLLIFPKGVNQIQMKVGISAVDIDGAKNNLETEINHWDFNVTRAYASKLWSNELDKIEFTSSDKDIMTNFYTALYHSFLAPNLFNDVDLRYRGRDNKIHQLENNSDKQYTVFSLWDTYRATHPLFTLTQVERTNQFIRTFLRQYKEGGDLPVWELAGNETECMIGYHSVSVIADAYLKGINDYNAIEALEAMITTANLDEFGKRQTHTNGFITASDEPESVSKTLEYAYDDFCINEMLNATDLSLRTDYINSNASQFTNSMYNFVNIYDPSTKFMRARRSGQWFSPFNPSEVNFNYTEANSWQYSLYAPHAIGVLTELIGGKDSLELWLDRLFSTESTLHGRHQVDITGLIGQYAHGNEPSHHMAYLYNYTNTPEKTQFFADKILREMYSNTPDGLSGNEDCGQMSSWYVLSSLGLYQVAPGSPYYDFGRPLMSKATLKLENGNSLIIKSISNSKENKYIEKIIYNGEELNRSYISHSDLIKGGMLEYYMSSEPKSFYQSLEHSPTLSSLPKSFVPTPFFDQENHIFTDSIILSLRSIENGSVEIYYSVDGTDPTKESIRYSTPFLLNKSTLVKAIAINDFGQSSIIANKFTKKDNDISLVLNTEYANQYAAGGEFTLIDGVRGGNEYRTGDWQGFYSKDVLAEVSFKNGRIINEIGVGCLRNMKSWIFYPIEIEISISEDGINYRKLDLIKGNQAEVNQEVENKTFTANTNSIQPIKKIKIRVKNPGKCPEWHLGAGNDTWLFLDEITLK